MKIINKLPGMPTNKRQKETELLIGRVYKHHFHANKVGRRFFKETIVGKVKTAGMAISKQS